jgi:hypothetical protein
MVCVGLGLCWAIAGWQLCAGDRLAYEIGGEEEAAEKLLEG